MKVLNVVSGKIISTSFMEVVVVVVFLKSWNFYSDLHIYWLWIYGWHNLDDVDQTLQENNVSVIK